MTLKNDPAPTKSINKRAEAMMCFYLICPIVCEESYIHNKQFSSIVLHLPSFMQLGRIELFDMDMKYLAHNWVIGPIP